MRLQELAAAIGAEVSGDATVEVTAVADPASVSAGGLLVVFDLDDVPEADHGPAAALLIPESAPRTAKPALRVSNPRLALARALAVLHPPAPPQPGVDAAASVHAGARLGSGVTIGAYAVLGEGCELGRGVVIGAGTILGAGVTIGDDAVIFPGVVIYDHTVVGRRVRIHAGVVIGSDGFGYADDGTHHVKIPHLGAVVIEDDVEIGANTTVDRATLGETRIGAGTKIDNLVQIGHNVRIGRDVIIIAQTGIAGSVTIGDRAVISGQVAVVDHVHIGAGALVLACSLVTKDVPPGAVVSGSPARPHREGLRQQAALRRLAGPGGPRGSGRSPRGSP